MKKTIVILAAGNGQRMQSDCPKILHALAGIPLIKWVVNKAFALKPERLIIVHKTQSRSIIEQAITDECSVRSEWLNQISQIQWVEQSKPLGTAHALQQALPFIESDQSVLVLYGDVPLVPLTILHSLMEKVQDRSLGIITACLENPAGFGRIIRNTAGDVTQIIEQKDLSGSQQDIKEIFSGILVAPGRLLKQILPSVRSQNAQHEYYLTDIIELACQSQYSIVTVKANDPLYIQGVNTPSDLIKIERFWQQCNAEKLLKAGVFISDPRRFDLRGTLQAGRDVFVDINVVLSGNVSLGDEVYIGQGSQLHNVKVGNKVVIKPYCIIEGASIGDGAIVGPFAHLRQGSQLHSDTKVGNFVEVKNSVLGQGSKASHLVYLGDAVVGKKVNIGAGVITCNYDGIKKNKTTIGDNAFVGSGCELIAPVTVGENAVIGAGSTISKNAPPQQLTLTRTKQRSLRRSKQKVNSLE